MSSPDNTTSENQENQEKTSITKEDEKKEIIHAKIMCQGCKSKVVIERALKENWQMCDVCGAFMCKTCQVDYATYSESVCPGSKNTEHHQMQLVPIPVKQLLDYIKHSPKQLIMDPVFKAFFSDFAKIADPFGEVISQFKEEAKIYNRYEELWQKQKNVLIQKTKNDILKY